MPRVLCIFGTRPEAIKMAPVIRALAASPEIETVTCSTGQHKEMLQQVLDLFQIVPDIDLHIMTQEQTLASLTAKLFAALDDTVQHTQPDWVLAQGDTTTVFVAAMVAFYYQVRFGHVEAGLRTGNKLSPFPEEINRRIADLVADAYFAPTSAARKNLIAEQVATERILVTGNTVVDALQYIATLPYNLDTGPLHRIPFQQHPIVTITMHRREKFGGVLRQLLQTIKGLAAQHPSVYFVYPVHLNPNVKIHVHEILGDAANVILLEPLAYLPMINLMRRSTLVLTDSGGIQEEAPTFGVPVLVLRDTTERPEGVSAGVAKLVGTERTAIIQAFEATLQQTIQQLSSRSQTNPYGDGQASKRILNFLLSQPIQPFKG